MENNETNDKIGFSIDPDQIKETAATVAAEAAKLIKKHPFESVGAALLVGLVIGLLVKRK